MQTTILNDRRELQKSIEYKYSRQHARNTLRQEIQASPEMLELINTGIQAIEQYLNKTYSYDSKNARIKELRLLDLDLEKLALDILVVIMPMEKPQLFTAVVGQLADRLGFEEKYAGIVTMAEILAVFEASDIYTIRKASKQASLMIGPNFNLPEKLSKFFKQTKYLPPMVCPPRAVRTNYDSGYLTKREAVILKGYNFHEEDVCLDSINRFNQIPLSLDTELLKLYSEPPIDFDTPEKKAKWEQVHPGESWVQELAKRKERWKQMVRDSYQVYVELVKQGNQFWLTHKVDKRGRTYCQGYHVSSQGNAFRKAILNFHEKELIEGV